VKPAEQVLGSTAELKESIQVNMLTEISGGFSCQARIILGKGKRMNLTGEGTRVSRFGRTEIASGVVLEIELPIAKLTR
jgi:hypothetical protein